MAIKRKKYKSRREKFQRDKRNLKLVVVFGVIALAVMIIMNRQAWYDWFVVTFMN